MFAEPSMMTTCRPLSKLPSKLMHESLDFSTYVCVCLLFLLVLQICFGFLRQPLIQLSGAPQTFTPFVAEDELELPIRLLLPPKRIRCKHYHTFFTSCFNWNKVSRAAHSPRSPDHSWVLIPLPQPECKDYKHELPCPAYIFFVIPEPVSIFSSFFLKFHDFSPALLLRWFQEHQQWLWSAAHHWKLCGALFSSTGLVFFLALPYLHSHLWFL